jgi:FlgD Ig-like domain
VSRSVTVGAAVFLCLLVATLVTAVLVVRARTPNLVLEVTDPPANHPASLQPTGPGPREVTITFFVRESDGHALVGIVDSHENVVRTLDADVALTKRDPVTYVWDGRTDAGGTAAPGRYRLLVELPSEDREMIWPRRMTVLPPAESG